MLAVAPTVMYLYIVLYNCCCYFSFLSFVRFKMVCKLFLQLVGIFDFVRVCASCFTAIFNRPIEQRPFRRPIGAALYPILPDEYVVNGVVLVNPVRFTL